MLSSVQLQFPSNKSSSAIVMGIGSLSLLLLYITITFSVSTKFSSHIFSRVLISFAAVNGLRLLMVDRFDA